jgi:hypothetical protein
MKESKRAQEVLEVQIAQETQAAQEVRLQFEAKKFL